MNSVFGGLHHLRMRLQPDKNQKNRRQKSPVFTAGSIFWPISRVMGVINEFGFQIRKIGDKKVFRFYSWQHILVHISGHGCEK